MELLFLLGIIGVVALMIGRGGGASEVVPREHLAAGEQPSEVCPSGNQLDRMALGLDDDDWLTDPAYSHLVGNIYHSSSGFGADEASDDSDSWSSLNGSDTLGGDDEFGTGLLGDDMVQSDNMFLDPEYFWLEGNIYHMDSDDSGMSDCCSSCDDSWDSGSGSDLDDW